MARTDHARPVGWLGGAAVVPLAVGFALLMGFAAGCSKKKAGTTPSRRTAAGRSTAGPDGPQGGTATTEVGSARASAEVGSARAAGEAGSARAAGEAGSARAASEPRGMARPAPRGLPRPAAPKVPTIADLRGLLSAGKYREAIAAARQVLSVNERSVSAMAVMAEAYFHLKNYPLCLAVLSVINEQQPGHPLYLYLRGRIALKDGDLEVAQRFFEDAVKKNPNLLDAWLVIGVRALQGGNYQKALSALQRAKKLPGGDTHAVNLNIGSCYRALAHQQNNPQLLLTARNYYNEAEKRYQQLPGKAGKPYLKAVYNKAILYLDAKVFPGLTKVKRLEQGIALLQQYVLLAARHDPRTWARERKAVMQILNKAKNVDLPAAKAMAQAQAAQRRAAAAGPPPRGGNDAPAPR